MLGHNNSNEYYRELSCWRLESFALGRPDGADLAFRIAEHDRTFFSVPAFSIRVMRS
jgi:hypothetical protein